LCISTSYHTFIPFSGDDSTPKLPSKYMYDVQTGKESETIVIKAKVLYNLKTMKPIKIIRPNLKKKEEKIKASDKNESSPWQIFKKNFHN